MREATLPKSNHSERLDLTFALYPGPQMKRDRFGKGGNDRTQDDMAGSVSSSCKEVVGESPKL